MVRRTGKVNRRCFRRPLWANRRACSRQFATRRELHRNRASAMRKATNRFIRIQDAQIWPTRTSRTSRTIRVSTESRSAPGSSCAWGRHRPSIIRTFFSMSERTDRSSVPIVRRFMFTTANCRATHRSRRIVNGTRRRPDGYNPSGHNRRHERVRLHPQISRPLCPAGVLTCFRFSLQAAALPV